MARTTGTGRKGQGAARRTVAEETKRGRPTKGLKPVTLKLAPEQHEALQDAVSRARLDRRPNASDGASFIVRELVQSWIDRGAKWPG